MFKQTQYYEQIHATPQIQTFKVQGTQYLWCVCISLGKKLIFIICYSHWIINSLVKLLKVMLPLNVLNDGSVLLAKADFDSFMNKTLNNVSVAVVCSC